MEEEYINFGDELILKSDFLKALNDAKSYSSTQPWSAARRGAFDAVAELAANRGILSTRKYTNPETGESMYYATFGGTPFDINTYDKNTRRGWLDYVNFVGKVAESLPTKKSIDEKKKKEEEERLAKLPTFDNEAFKNLLIKDITTGTFGGTKFDINEWNKLDDVRDETGAVGTSERKRILAQHLRNIDRDFKAEDYSWKDSPFKDADDFKSRIATAVGALESPETDDDVPALRNLGLNYEKMFNNRTGEIYGLDEAGNPVTYGAYYRGLLEAEDAKTKEAVDKAAALLKAQRENQYTNYRFYTGQGTPISLENRKDIKAYVNNNIRKGLTPQTQSELVWLFRNHPQAWENLTKDELAKFGRGYANTPNRLKKIRGIEGVYWDTAGNRVIHPTKGVLANPNNDILSIMNQNDPEYVKNKQQQEYMNSTEGGFTPAELREVAALLLDLGAAVDPEGVTSATLAQIAAGIRDYNRSTDPEGWTWSDTLWTTLDHGLGLVSAIPFVGGLIKGAWAAEKFGKYIPKIEQWVKYMGRAGSTYAMASNAPGALNAIEKIKKGEDLSLKDYLDLAYFFIGGLGHHQLNRGNRIERTAMKARGVETSNSVLNKAGITRTTAKSGTTAKTTPTLKVKKTGEDGKVETKEISIDAETQKILKGTNPKELDAKAKELGIKIPEGYKVATPTTSWSRGKLNEYRSKYFNNGNKEIFGTQTLQTQSSGLKSDEEFEQYLSEHNNTWLKKVFNGSNRDIRRYDRYRGVRPIQQENSETPTPKSETNNSGNKPTLTYNDLVKLEYNALNVPNSKSSRLISSGKHTGTLADGLKYNFEYITKDGKKIALVTDNAGVILFSREVKNQAEAKESFTNFVKTINDKIKLNPQFIRRFSKEYLQSIRELKKKGVFYKHGGTLDETIENFLKNNNI